MGYFEWFIACFSVLGIWLNIKKNKFCFLIWMITNFSWMLIDFKIGLYSQSALFFLYFLLAIFGLFHWKDN